MSKTVLERRLNLQGENFSLLYAQEFGRKSGSSIRTKEDRSLCWHYMGESTKKTKDSREQKGKWVCHGTSRSLTGGKLDPTPKQADVASLQRADMTFDHIHLPQWSRVQHLHLIVLKNYVTSLYGSRF